MKTETLNYDSPPEGSMTYVRQSFGNWAEYGDEVTTRTKQARRLGRLLSELVRRKRLEGARLEKVEWFDHSDFVDDFPRIGWKVRLWVPMKEGVS